MSRSTYVFLTAYAALMAVIMALTIVFPDCRDITCPSNKGNTAAHINYDLTQTWALNEWTTLGGEVVAGPDSAEFTINKQRDSLTIVTDYYIFYGEVSVEMKASPGSGIVSCIHALADHNDEIDWGMHQEVFHNYTWIWSKEKLSWAIDGTVVRTVHYADAKGDTRFPQTPMRVRIGTWATGDSVRSKGTVGWAGGETDYSNAPFTMYVKSIKIVNYIPAERYFHSGRSDSSDSIKTDGRIPSTRTSAAIDIPRQDVSDIPLCEMTIHQIYHHLETKVQNILDFISTIARPTFVLRTGTGTSATDSWDLFFLQVFAVIVVLLLMMVIVSAWMCFFSRDKF
ncbi:hypothetical protein N7489_008241 [Penicillium chrysogenum]|uniref:uncharacterized protein n=1 Tax=Penicillium chrysogenum TaxID=5076 RepID=UPI0024DF1044|nr:uncharacterized protein N7489_008241 [Penicillium chrysogenum]KAJ5238150.1 hypothetical protein N7489_008241 [Penicillium chrysogenum]